MAREIYNLGRVTGLSAYELNVKHQMEEYPDIPSMTEKEWIAATITAGASLVLKIPAGTAAGAHDYPLPAESSLCSGNSLIAYPFAGECVFGTDGWATKVTSYGPLIANTEATHPVSPGSSPSDIPLSPTKDTEIANLVAQMKDYVKIVDGIIYQAGTWTPSGTTPYMDFKPNFNLGSTIRLYFDKKVDKEIHILFTGLVNRAIVAGASKLDSSPVNSPDPEDGDFIGPEVFPWGSKILFTIPTTMMRLYSANVTDVSPDANYKAYSANVEIDGYQVSSVALEDPNGNKLRFDGGSGKIPSDLVSNVQTGYNYLTWKALLHALATNQAIDILTDKLRTFRSYLPDIHTETNLYVGGDGQIKQALSIGTDLTVGRNATIAGNLQVKGTTTTKNLTVAEKTTTKDLEATSNYITVNGIRLYVSHTQPTGTIPEGSLGIGW